VFRDDHGRLLRQVNRAYEPHYKQLMESNLYAELVADGLLIDHEELSLDGAVDDQACRIIKPRELPFVSYPYEWSFSALQDAALLTLRIQRKALAEGLTLKDASAYNVQFEGSRPVLIDTLSFERYEPGQPWIAYGQFCRHFLAPLALMSRRDIRLGQLTRLHLDGIPLDLASRLLPWSTYCQPGLTFHLHLHARLVARCAAANDRTSESTKRQLSSSSLEALLDNLTRTVQRLSWRPRGTPWADYYENHSYTDVAFEQKKQVVREYLQQTAPRSVWDLGANRGVFSRLASQMGAVTCALDIDPACVERNYCQARSTGDTLLLPLQMDLTNPSPATGWNLAERESLIHRGPCDTAMALALVHHLAIANNVPLDLVAAHLRQLCRHLIIEFVPKSDPQVRRLLRTRQDIFPDYCQDGFESAFERWFTILDRRLLSGDGRVLYLMQTGS
jgi:ribosomal protein L11 methylase PrmA